MSTNKMSTTKIMSTEENTYSNYKHYANLFR